MAAVRVADLVIEPRPVAHTSHPAWGYLLRLPMASDAAGRDRPIRFARGAGGHMAALQAVGQAREHRVARLVFAHIGRPSLRAIDTGCRLPFGEWGEPGHTYQLPPQAHNIARHAR